MDLNSDILSGAINTGEKSAGELKDEAQKMLSALREQQQEALSNQLRKMKEDLSGETHEEPVINLQEMQIEGGLLPPVEGMEKIRHIQQSNLEKLLKHFSPENKT